MLILELSIRTLLEVLDPGHVAQLELVVDLVRVHRRGHVLLADLEGPADGESVVFGSPSPSRPVETAVA